MDHYYNIDRDKLLKRADMAWQSAYVELGISYSICSYQLSERYGDEDKDIELGTEALYRTARLMRSLHGKQLYEYEKVEHLLVRTIDRVKKCNTVTMRSIAAGCYEQLTNLHLQHNQIDKAWKTIGLAMKIAPEESSSNFHERLAQSYVGQRHGIKDVDEMTRDAIDNVEYGIRNNYLNHEAGRGHSCFRKAILVHESNTRHAIELLEEAIGHYLSSEWHSVRYYEGLAHVSIAYLLLKDGPYQNKEVGRQNLAIGKFLLNGETAIPYSLLIDGMEVLRNVWQEPLTADQLKDLILRSGSENPIRKAADNFAHKQAQVENTLSSDLRMVMSVLTNIGEVNLETAALFSPFDGGQKECYRLIKAALGAEPVNILASESPEVLEIKEQIIRFIAGKNAD